MPTLEDAVEAIRLGNPEEGRQILEELLEAEEDNPEIWLWLSTVVDNDEDCEICLENVLALDPDSSVAQRGLDALKVGAFNPNIILDELLDIDKDEISEPTFIDDFVITDDDALPDDDEIKFPSTMSTGPKPKKSGKGCQPNLRIILLAVVVVIIVVALAGLAAVNLFFGGDGDNGGPSGGQTQEIPTDGGGEQPPSPTATDTPTPTPTNTPTPTITPFQLPTPLPTAEPSPTATQVVAPTPNN